MALYRKWHHVCVTLWLRQEALSDRCGWRVVKRDASFGSYSPHSVTLRKWWVAMACHHKSKHNKPQFLPNSPVIRRWIIPPHASMSWNARAALEPASADREFSGIRSLCVTLPCLCDVPWVINPLVAHDILQLFSDSLLKHGESLAWAR